MEKELAYMNIRDVSDITAKGEAEIAYSDEDFLIIDSAKEIKDSQPIRMGMYTIAVCKNGRVQGDMNGKTILMEKNQILICPPNTTIENIMTSPDYECKFICLTNRILQAFLRPYINIWNQAMFVNKMKVRDLDERGTDFAVKFQELLSLCIQSEAHIKYKKEVVRSLVQAGLLGLCGSLETSMEEDKYYAPSHSSSTFRKFLDLLSNEGNMRHTVNYYADKLCITPKYLSILCTKNSGKTAKEWIDEYTMENVRYYLTSTDKSMKEITDILGFPNSSYLGRYVRERFGVSPLAYRNGKGKDIKKAKEKR